MIAAARHAETIWFAHARPLTDWIVNGQTVPGHELNGLAIPWRVLDEPVRPDLPAQYVVIGRRDHPDGRWFLEFGISAEWVVATSGGTYTWVAGEKYPVVTCPDCGGLRGTHVKVMVKSRYGGMVEGRCPSDPSRGSR